MINLKSSQMRLNKKTELFLKLKHFYILTFRFLRCYLGKF